MNEGVLLIVEANVGLFGTCEECFRAG